MFEKHIISTR